jgi:hypothetical protein
MRKKVESSGSELSAKIAESKKEMGEIRESLDQVRAQHLLNPKFVLAYACRTQELPEFADAYLLRSDEITYWAEADRLADWVISQQGQQNIDVSFNKFNNICGVVMAIASPLPSTKAVFILCTLKIIRQCSLSPNFNPKELLGKAFELDSELTLVRVECDPILSSFSNEVESLRKISS